MGFPATLNMMRRMANHLLKKNTMLDSQDEEETPLTVGKNWVYKFKSKHPKIQAT